MTSSVDPDPSFHSCFEYTSMSESTDIKTNNTPKGGSRGSRPGHRPPNHAGIPAPQQKKQGLVPALGEHIFDYNVSNAASQM
jgi:hypothetical protein